MQASTGGDFPYANTDQIRHTLHTLLGGRGSGGDFTHSNLNIIREGRTLAHELHNTHRALASPGGGTFRQPHFWHLSLRNDIAKTGADLNH